MLDTAEALDKLRRTARPVISPRAPALIVCYDDATVSWKRSYGDKDMGRSTPASIATR